MILFPSSLTGPWSFVVLSAFDYLSQAQVSRVCPRAHQCHGLKVCKEHRSGVSHFPKHLALSEADSLTQQFLVHGSVYSFHRLQIWVMAATGRCKYLNTPP